MPRSLAQRPRDRRGYPITAVTAILPEGLPDFAQIDQRLVLRCAVEDRCGLCGAPHGDGGLVAFLGPLSAVGDPLAGYGNPPMHLGCAEAAVWLCPYIAYQRTRRRAEAAPASAAALALAALGLLAPPAKPDPWALVATRTWTARIAGHTFARPRPPLRLPAATLARITAHNSVLFRPGPPVRLRLFSYDPAGHLRERRGAAADQSLQHRGEHG